MQCTGLWRATAVESMHKQHFPEPCNQEGITVYVFPHLCAPTYDSLMVARACRSAHCPVAQLAETVMKLQKVELPTPLCYLHQASQTVAFANLNQLLFEC